MIQFALAAALLLLPTPALAQVPDDRQVVFEVAQQFNVGTPAGLDAFIDAAACALNAKDSNWGHLRKTGSGTQTHGHAHDGVLHKSGAFVDIVIAAGASNARVTWDPHAPIYTQNDWLPPHNCGGTLPIPDVPTHPDASPVVDLAPVLARLDALTAEVSALRLAMASVGESLSQTTARVETVIQSTDRIIQAQLSPPNYAGRVLGFAVTLRPVQP